MGDTLEAPHRLQTFLVSQFEHVVWEAILSQRIGEKGEKNDIIEINAPPYTSFLHPPTSCIDAALI